MAPETILCRASETKGRDSDAKKKKEKGETDLFFFLPPSPRHRSFPFIQRVACAVFPQRGIYNFDSFSLIARNSGIRINNCFCRKFYCVSTCARAPVYAVRVKDFMANGFMAKKFLRGVPAHISAALLLNCFHSAEVIARQIRNRDSFAKSSRNRQRPRDIGRAPFFLNTAGP